jgi:hypothetical protein
VRLIYDLAGENKLDLETFRAWLWRMSDSELIRFVKFARYMCSPEANLGKAPAQRVRNPIEGSGGGMAGRHQTRLR